MSYSLPISIRHFVCSIDESIGTFQFGRTLLTPRSTASSTTAFMAYCVVPNTMLVLTSTIFVCPAGTSSCIFRAVRVNIIEALPYTALPVIVFICLLPPITTYECLILRIPITEYQETIPIFTNTVDTDREQNKRQIVCMNKKKSFKDIFNTIPISWDTQRILMIYLFALALRLISIHSKRFRWRDFLWKSRQGKILQLHRPQLMLNNEALKIQWRWMCSVDT